jgi:hypothetical protein
MGNILNPWLKNRNDSENGSAEKSKWIFRRGRLSFPDYGRHGHAKASIMS